MPANEAGRRQLGGWLDGRGRFYPAGYGAHLQVGFQLRTTGDGPADPWDMAHSSWVMVRAHGQVLALPGRISQGQLDSLADMLHAAPEGQYRSALLTSLRQLRDLEMCSR